MAAPLLMLLHGARMSPPSWQDVVTQIGGERRLVAPWLRGLKPTQNGDFDIDSAVSELLTRIDMDDDDQVDLCGIDLGGMVALRLAALAPTMVRRLVVINTPIVPSKGALRVQKTLLRLMPEARFAQSGITKKAALNALDAMAKLDLGGSLATVTAPTLVISASDKAAQATADILIGQLATAEKKTLSGDDLLGAQATDLAGAITDFLDRP